jgi:hypothetical protein
MSTTNAGLPPVPYQAPITGKTFIITPIWADWFRQNLARIASLVSSAGATTVNGMVKGNGVVFSEATAGTDYAPGTAGDATGILKSTTGTGALSIATASDFPTLNQNTSGNAATVTTNADLTGPVTSTGNATAIGAGALTSAMLANTTVTAGAYTNANITVNDQGQVTEAANGSGGSSSGGGAYAILENAVWAPFITFGQHAVTATQSLTAVNLGLNNTGGVSSTATVRVNQWRSNALLASATASITVAANTIGTAVGASLSGTLSTLSGDLLTYDTVTVTGAPESLTLEH